MQMLNPRPLVTIVIPVFNGSDFLSQAIDSAIAQTYSPIEIIVVNDGSHDAGKSENVARSYGDKIRYFSKENGGVASALNLAIANMKGDYFSWLSHDDLYYPEKISSQIATLENLDLRNIILYGDYSTFTTNPQEVNEIHLAAVPFNRFRYFLTISNTLHGCTLLIPRHAFSKCGVFREDLLTTQDYDLWFRLAGSYHFFHAPTMLVKARHHELQTSVTLKHAARNEINRLMSGFTLRLSSQELANEAKGSNCLAYARIAASFWRRRFFAAARLASRITVVNLGIDSLWASAKAIAVLTFAVIHIGMRISARSVINFVQRLFQN